MRGFTAFARGYPGGDTFAPHPTASPVKRSRHGLCRRIFPHLLFRNDLRIFSMETRENLALVSDKHHAFRLQFFVIRLQLIRRRRLDRTVIPKQVQWRPGSLGGESEADLAGIGKGIIVPDRHGDLVPESAGMTGPGFHPCRSVQIKFSKHGPEAVMAHVRQSPTAELIPTPKDGMGVMRMVRSIE